MPHLYFLAVYEMEIFPGVTKYIFFGVCKPAWHGSFQRMMGCGQRRKEGKRGRIWSLATAAVHGVAESWTRLSDFTFTFHFHASEKEMATHSSVLAWRSPGTGEPGGLPSMGSHSVGHNLRDLAAAAAATAVGFLKLRYVQVFHA